METIQAIFKRLTEPSTYAGLMGAAMLLGASNAEFMNYTNAIAAICSFLAVIISEKK